MTLNSPEVCVARAARACYPSQAPYHPHERYPELPQIPTSSDRNDAFDAVRRALSGLGLDRSRYGTAAWNPLSELVRPGDRVLLKPNFIRDSHEPEWNGRLMDLNPSTAFTFRLHSGWVGHIERKLTTQAAS